MKIDPLLVALLSGLAGGIGLHAQQADPQQKHGSIFPEKNSAVNFNTGGWPAATAAQLKASIEKVRPVICQAGPLKPPVGCDAVYNEFDLPLSKYIPWQKAASVVVNFGLPEYYLDNRANTIKPGTEALANIEVEVNSFRHVYVDMNDHGISAAGFPCPTFFFLYTQKTADSTHDYAEYQLTDGSKPFRVVTNGKPIYVPFMREQYLTFQIQSDETSADEANRTYVHDSVTIANGPMKKDILKGEADLVNTWRQRLDKHRQQMAALTADQRKQPAVVIWGGNAGPDDMQELTTADDDRGQKLWTINPDYFNKSLPATAIQVIVVTPEYAHIAPPFIKAKVMEVFRAIDYKALRSLIQN